MATLRSHVTIDRPADEVWSVVSDAGRVSEWFPVIATSTSSGNRRSCRLEGGVPLEEEILTNDADLRRFQYRIVGGGLPADTHLGTVDVLDLGDGRSLVVYSTEVTPDAVARKLRGAIEGGVRGLKEHCEGRG